jgi:hypothetical protein
LNEETYMKKPSNLIRLFGLLFFIGFLWQTYLFIDLMTSPKLTAKDFHSKGLQLYPDDLSETERIYAEKYYEKSAITFEKVSELIRRKKLKYHFLTSFWLLLISLILLIWSFDRNRLIKTSK